MDGYQLNIKTEPNIVEIKKEDIMSCECSDDESTDKADFITKALAFPTDLITHNIKQEFMEPKCTNIETEDESSDEFIEDHSWIKTEKLTECDSKGHENDIDTVFFNRKLKEAYIKDNIGTGDHKIQIKTEKLCELKQYEKEIENACYDEEPNEACVEEDIKIEDHKIKFEIDEDNTETKHKHDGPPETKITKTTLKCKFCSYETPLQTSLKKHLSLHEDPNKIRFYFCPKCNYKTRQKCHLKRHDLIHQNISNLELFTCEICSFKTKQKCTLKRHISNVHIKEIQDGKIKGFISNGNNEQLSCSKCSYTTCKRSLLLAHLDKHKDTTILSNIYICDICSFSTKYRRNLRMHLDTHKDSEDLQVYECKLCKFKTRIGYCLKRHLLSKKHLQAAGQIEEYVPRPVKL